MDSEKALSVYRHKRSKTMTEKIMEIVFMFCGIIAVAAVLVISIYMLISGGPAVKEIGVFKFLLGKVWAPTAADPQFGILPMILSSIFGTFGAILIGVPIGLLTAVFISQIAKKRAAAVVMPAVELLAGIPSVVYGLVGMLAVVPAVAKIFPEATQYNGGATLFSAIIVLSVMVLPTIVSVSVTSLNSVPEEYKLASLALGGTKIQTIFKVMLPAARSGIATAVVLGIGRAIGEAMAVIMVSGNVVNMPNLFGSVRFLTTGIVSEMGYSADLHRQALFAIGLVLFIFIFIINIVLNRIIKKRRV